MNTTTTTKIKTNDGTPLCDVLSSPKNIALLKAQDIVSIGDLAKTNIPALMHMGVGEMTIEEIRGLGKAEESAPIKIMEHEESHAPLMIRSPSSGYSLQVCPGDAIASPTGRGTRIVQPIYIVCRGGVGRLKREMWFNREFDRDIKKVEDAVEKNRPWRKKAAKWLKSRKNHGKMFVIMSD